MINYGLVITVVVIVNASLWEHFWYRGGVGLSIWYVVDLVDVSM